MTQETNHTIAAVLYADVERSALGTPSRMADELAGTPVLTRTLQRLEQAQQLGDIFLFCPETQREAIETLAAGTRTQVMPLSERPPARPAVRRRKWALASWRGGLHECTHFDEHIITIEMFNALIEYQPSSVLLTAPEAVLIDPVLVDRLIEHHLAYGQDMRFTFSQAPPGLAGCIFRMDLLREVLQAQATIGQLLNYNPAEPRPDYINDACCLRLAQELVVSPHRYVADTGTSAAALAHVLERLPDTADAATTRTEEWNPNPQEKAETGSDALDVTALMAEIQATSPVLPEELEIEITTAPTLRVVGYPHNDAARPEQMMTLEQFGKIVDDCAGRDDIRLTLGGFGEPLRHPDLIALVRRAKSAGILAIHIETDGRALDDAMIDALLAEDIDVISVHLDADSPELYQQLKGADGFEQLCANLERFAEKAKALPNGPVLVPQLTKMRETMGEMEAFYDRWLQCCDAAVIVGYNDFAGQIPSRAVMDMSPPSRRMCRRLQEQLTILADGRAVLCSQDFAGGQVVGDVSQQTLEEIWSGSSLARTRSAHREGAFEQNPLCAQCKEWHR